MKFQVMFAVILLRFFNSDAADAAVSYAVPQWLGGFLSRIPCWWLPYVKLMGGLPPENFFGYDKFKYRSTDDRWISSVTYTTPFESAEYVEQFRETRVTNDWKEYFYGDIDCAVRISPNILKQSENETYSLPVRERIWINQWWRGGARNIASAWRPGDGNDALDRHLEYCIRFKAKGVSNPCDTPAPNTWMSRCEVMFNIFLIPNGFIDGWTKFKNANHAESVHKIAWKPLSSIEQSAEQKEILKWLLHEAELPFYEEYFLSQFASKKEIKETFKSSDDLFRRLPKAGEYSTNTKKANVEKLWSAIQSISL